MVKKVGRTDTTARMYSAGAIKQPKGGTDPPDRRSTADLNVFSQQREQEPRTPTRPRTRQEIQAKEQMDFDMDTETQTTAEAKAIVVSQLENLCRELKRFSDHHGWSQCTKEAAYTVAKKFMPELIAAGERRHADGNADSLRALQETAELCATIKDLAKAVNTLMARQEATPTQNGENPETIPRGTRREDGIRNGTDIQTIGESQPTLSQTHTTKP
ncbi:hypothetical protein H2248_007657 [Termitomyces sp. 'cryptogamus']|nr:hypothetical protein H2248_007657 [Termitomyces sp. 'cryptogamus']